MPIGVFCRNEAPTFDAETRAQIDEITERKGKGDLAQALSSSRGQPDALLDSYAKNQAEMQRAVADHLLSVNAMLRPDQREGFRTLLRTEMFRGIRPLPAGVVGEP